MKTSTIVIACTPFLIASVAARCAAAGQCPTCRRSLSRRRRTSCRSRRACTKGTISVRNTGSAAAGPFKVTVECNVDGPARRLRRTSADATRRPMRMRHSRTS